MLAERHPLCRAGFAHHLLALKEETELLSSMGYLPDWWGHAVKDRRVVESCQASLEAAAPAQQMAFAQLDDAFDVEQGGTAAGRFMTNNIQLPAADGASTLGDFAVYENYSRINHSCEPNVRVELKHNGELTVLALVDLPRRDEIRDHYLAEMEADRQ